MWKKDENFPSISELFLRTQIYYDNLLSELVLKQNTGSIRF